MCESLTLHAADADDTRAVGAAIANAVVGIDSPLVISLEGELGAGKTTLVGGLLNSLGHHGHVRSPTYTLIEPYELEHRSVYHLDLYRLVDPREVEALGLRDLLHPRCIFLIEWPDRGGALLPPFDIGVALRYAGSVGREISMTALSAMGIRLLSRLSGVTKP